ncbi:hypothetical protein P7K49_030033 [Saguinus oedipus]|uniref:Uncharacterized protein n=1 Tax=Saguinus oedipus TaxID=9490 RepID=A0ABQ9U118_SAGOE|nr:hypothetical protein P7K49_030033 [Saguinus oedipus]
MQKDSWCPWKGPLQTDSSLTKAVARPLMLSSEALVKRLRVTAALMAHSPHQPRPASWAPRERIHATEPSSKEQAGPSAAEPARNGTSKGAVGATSTVLSARTLQRVWNLPLQIPVVQANLSYSTSSTIRIPPMTEAYKGKAKENRYPTQLLGWDESSQRTPELALKDQQGFSGGLRADRTRSRECRSMSEHMEGKGREHLENGKPTGTESVQTAGKLHQQGSASPPTSRSSKTGTRLKVINYCPKGTTDGGLKDFPGGYLNQTLPSGPCPSQFCKDSQEDQEAEVTSQYLRALSEPPKMRKNAPSYTTVLMREGERGGVGATIYAASYIPSGLGPPYRFSHGVQRTVTAGVAQQS